jgi:cytochrome c oxidase assembly protein subunit 15
VARGLAIVTAAATLVLILFGGLVTNTGAALAVPDWPTTFGYNMFLYPWSEMIGGIFYEHSHRLIGSVVGLLTLALAAVLWRRGSTLRVLGVVAALAVVVQGLLGGMRVVLRQDVLAILHGCLAQAFFALLAVIVLLTSARTRAPLARIEPSTRNLALGAAAVAYVQIVLGALVTHAGIVDLHLIGAFAVFAIVPMLTARLRRSGDAVAAPLASVLLALLGVQLALGVGAYLARFSSMWIPGGQATMLVLPVAHRLVAALILAATTVLAVLVSKPRWSAHSEGGERWIRSGYVRIPDSIEREPRNEPISQPPIQQSHSVSSTLTHGASRRELSLNPIGTMNAATPYPSLSPTDRTGLGASVP